LKSFAKELKINENEFFNSNQIKLSRISGSLQTDLNLKFLLLKDEFKGKWKILKKVAGYIDSKIIETEKIYDIGNKFKYKCPACRNIALIYFKPVRETYIKNEQVNEVITGFLMQNFKCEFCGLETDEAIILDLIMANKRNDVDQSLNIYDERI
jgi:phage FluMu protein Com